MWWRSRERGYTRPKYVPKPYEQTLYPGQRVQIDVKYVPSVCLAGDAKGQRLYQYNAIDEYSRLRYGKAFEEHNTYSSMIFPKNVVRSFKFPIECVQISSAKRDLPTLFNKPAFYKKPTQKTVYRMWNTVLHALLCGSYPKGKAPPGAMLRACKGMTDRVNRFSLRALSPTPK